MKIFVTDGNNRAALAITRALGMSNHTLFVGEKTNPCLAGSSKYCTSVYQYPDPNTQPESFLKYIENVCATLSIDYIIPVSDVTTLLISERKKTGIPNCAVPFPDHEIIVKAADKLHVLELAKKLDLPIPETLVIRTKDEIPQVKNIQKYPVVIKPSRSRIRTTSGWLFTTVNYAKDREELVSILTKKSSDEFPILLQERIIGPGIGIFVCCNNGKIVRTFSHRRLREKPPSGGVSVLRESITPNPAAQDFSQKLMQNLGWHGVAMIEFKLDIKDNIPKLMEINGRFWGSLQLAIDSGINFPNLLLDIYQNKQITQDNNYKTGVRSRWLLGDLDSLLMVLFKSKSKLNLPPNHEGRLKTLLNFLKFWQRNTYYEILRFNDIQPWLYELKSWLFQKK